MAGTELVEAALTVPASRTQTPARSRSVPVSARTSEVAVTMTPRARAMRFIGCEAACFLEPKFVADARARAASFCLSALASSVNNILPKP